VSQALLGASVNSQLVPGFSVEGDEFRWTGAWLWVTKNVEAGQWLELGGNFFD
jgi:hypothetical protein